MKKIASIDIGTNSVLYSLFEIEDGTIAHELHFERHSPRIGQKLKGQKKPRITEDTYDTLCKILTRHRRHAIKHHAEAMVIAATNPLRLAVNGADIQKRLSAYLGNTVDILSPDDEARLSFIGAVGRLRHNQVRTVIDLGGGSTELVVYRGDRRKAFISLPEGAVSLTERFRADNPVDPGQFPSFEKYLAQYDKMVSAVVPYIKHGVTLVGGTSSALALMKDNQYIERGEAIPLTAGDLDLFANLLAPLNVGCRRRLLKTDKKRSEIIFTGAFWYRYVFKMLRLTTAMASPRGLRHGMAIEWSGNR